MNKRTWIITALMVVAFSIGIIVGQQEQVPDETQSTVATDPNESVIEKIGVLEALHGRVTVGDGEGNWIYMCHLKVGMEIQDEERYTSSVPRPTVRISVRYEDHGDHRDCETIVVEEFPVRANGVV